MIKEGQNDVDVLWKSDEMYFPCEIDKHSSIFEVVRYFCRQHLSLLNGSQHLNVLQKDLHTLHPG